MASTFLIFVVTALEDFAEFSVGAMKKQLNLKSGKKIVGRTTVNFCKITQITLFLHKQRQAEIDKNSSKC